jgi:hypothetical protein
MNYLMNNGTGKEGDGAWISDHCESEQYLRYGNTLHQFQLRIFVSNIKWCI